MLLRANGDLIKMQICLRLSVASQCSRDRIQILPLAHGALGWPPTAHSSSPFCTCPCDLLQPSCLLPSPHRPVLSPNHSLLPLRGHLAFLPLLLSFLSHSCPSHTWVGQLLCSPSNHSSGAAPRGNPLSTPRLGIPNAQCTASCSSSHVYCVCKHLFNVHFSTRYTRREGGA